MADEQDDMKTQNTPSIVTLAQINTLRDSILSKIESNKSLRAQLDMNPDGATMEALQKTISENDNYILEKTAELTEMIRQYNFANEPLPGFPKYGEPIIRVGENLTINWNLRDITDISFYLLKGNTKTLLANESVSGSSFEDAHIRASGSKTIAIDQNFYSSEYLPCKVRIEMVDDPTVYTDTTAFKVLKSN